MTLSMFLLLSTFVYVNNVWMLHRAHDLYFSSYSNQISICLDFTLLDSLDGHLLTSLFVDSQLNFTIGSLAQFFYDIESVTKE